MAYSRYSSREIFLNDNDGYEKQFFEQRGVKMISQYDTPVISYPQNETQMARLSPISSIWSATDRLYKVSHEYYGSPDYWWVIAWFNQKPTEGHFTPGDIFYIPLPLAEAIRMYEG